MALHLAINSGLLQPVTASRHGKVVLGRWDRIPSAVGVILANSPPVTLLTLLPKVSPGRRLFTLRIVVAFMTAALDACTVSRPPAFSEIFAGAPVAQQPPLIVIPGVLGSRLFDVATGKLLWPPDIAMLISGWRVRKLELPITGQNGAAEPEVIPSGLLLSALDRDYYGGLLDALSEVGYRCAAPSEVTADTSCILFAWDWRKGIVAAAASLDNVIERVRAQRRKPDMKFDIVADSAGALIARYYARFGGTDVVDQDRAVDQDQRADDSVASAHRSIRRMILIGPPNLGSLDTVESLMRGYRAGPFDVGPEILASFETSYQLLPPPGVDWLIDRRGKPVSLDLYDIATWSKLGVSIFSSEVRERISAHFDSEQETRRYMDALATRFRGSLARARRFQKALSAPLPENSPLGYFVFGSDYESTPKRAVLENVDGRQALSFRPKEIAEPIGGVDYRRLMLEPGDGRVTRSSLLGRISAARQIDRHASLPITNLVFVCARHAEMSSNFEILHNIIDLLFYGWQARRVDTLLRQTPAGTIGSCAYSLIESRSKHTERCTGKSLEVRNSGRDTIGQAKHRPQQIL